MHGDLNRIAIHQSLDTLGLISVGQLVCCIYIDLNLAAGGLLHELAELAAALSPGTGLGGGAGEVPGLLLPAQITVIADFVKIHAAGLSSAAGLALRGSHNGSAVGAISCQCLRKEGGNRRYIGDQKQNYHGSCDHRHDCAGDLRNIHFHAFFQFYRNRNEQVYADRRSYLADCQVHGCHDTERHHIVTQCLTYRQHDWDENVHRRVCVNEAACDQEDHIHDQQEGELVMRNAAQQVGSRLRNTELGTYEGEQRRTGHNEHDAACGLSGLHQKSAKILKAYFLINKNTDKQTIYDGHRRCLGRGKDTAVNAAQDDDRHQQSPECILECIPAFFSAGALLAGLHIVLAGLDHNHNDQGYTHQDSRNDSCREHICDGNAGDGGIDNECDARRDDDGNGAGRCH